MTTGEPEHSPGDPPTGRIEPERATQDALTGLPNRIGALLALDRIGQEAGLDSVSLVSVEISRFGAMNDSLGPELGDRVMAMTARRLTKLFPDSLLVARIHGDHFCLAFDRRVDLDAVVAKLADFTQRPFALAGEVVVLSVKIGVARAGCGADSAQGLLHAAEVALHQAKLGPDQVAFYSHDILEKARLAHRLENDLRLSLVTNAAALHAALVNDEFFLCYQPVVSAATGRIAYLEALLRWNHPHHGVVSPALFIPIAEDIGIMDVLGAWVLRRACTDAANWPIQPGGSQPGVSVNVSPTQFGDNRLIDLALDQALQESGLAPQRLQLEITESAGMSDALAERLQTLRERGCRIALDDFGTGYSALTRLHSFPLDYIKIDRSFLSDWDQSDPPKSRKREQLLRSMLALCRILEITSVVEGVETQDQLQQLKAWGADLVQGYLYARPLAAAQAPQWITAHPAITAGHPAHD